MAKRFIDTDLWNKSWFRKLPVKMKAAWMYLILRCDNAGIFEIDMERLEFEIGAKISLTELQEAFDVVEIGEDKLWIPGFIPYQYNCKISELNPGNNAHLSVIRRIEKLGIVEPLVSPSLAPQELLPSPLPGALDKDKDKDKDKGECEGKVKGSKFLVPKSDLDEIYASYPRKQGKKRGFDVVKRDIKSSQDLDRLKLAVKNYSDFVHREKTEVKFIKLFSTFMGEWSDWCDPETGTGSVRASSVDLSSIFQKTEGVAS